MRKVEWRTCKSGGEGSTGGRPDQPVSGSTTRGGESNDGNNGNHRQINMEDRRFLMVKRNLFAFAPGVLRRRVFFVLQWPLGQQQLFTPGHIKYCSQEMQPPQTDVVRSSNERSKLAKVRCTYVLSLSVFGLWSRRLHKVTDDRPDQTWTAQPTSEPNRLRILEQRHPAGISPFPKNTNDETP